MTRLNHLQHVYILSSINIKEDCVKTIVRKEVYQNIYTALMQCTSCVYIKYQNSFLPSTIKMNGISICVFGRESHPFNGIFTLKEKQLVMMFA